MASKARHLPFRGISPALRCNGIRRVKDYCDKGRAKTNKDDDVFEALREKLQPIKYRRKKRLSKHSSPKPR